ncbi:hypothetical protein Trydic_g8682 [Trypoxylus dichotomus]
MKSKLLFVLTIYFGCAFLSQYVSAQLDSPHCFRFTWLGPQYDNSSTLANITCSEYLDDIRAVGVPCRQPFVITEDATPPDIDYLWEHHASEVTCRTARGSVCAKFSYTFNDAIQNITYMCTQAYSVGERAITGGCYQQIIDGYQVEVCLCQSVAGYRPCNEATPLKMSVMLLAILGFLKFILNI